MDDSRPQAVAAAEVDRSGGAALPRRILVGVEEGPAAADALALAAALREVADAELVVASVRPFWPEAIPRGERGRLLAEEEDHLRHEVAPLLDGSGFRTRVIAGGPVGDGLHEIAVAERADLIVIASTHRGPIGRVLPGSVGERVLDGAPCAVAIAPRGHGSGERGGRAELRRVLVGCDGSRESAAALDLAAALARRAGAAIVLVGVVEMRFDLAGFPHPADPEETARIERARARARPARAETPRIERALARARAALAPDLTVATEQVHGIAPEVIAALARDADLLAIGSRGSYGRVRRLFLGGVAAKVARTAPCPTVIVPAG